MFAQLNRTVIKATMVGLAATLASACVPMTGERADSASGPAKDGVVATLRDAQGKTVGTAEIREATNGLMLTVAVTGLTPGPRGIHIHATGRCDAPDFSSAGGHWNPTSRQHGHDNPMGAHAGDLPNILVGADGTGSITAPVSGGMLMSGSSALMDGDGASIVLHAAADDMRSDPSGNSGARIACGVFG